MGRDLPQKGDIKMSKITKKEILYSHIIEARKKIEICIRSKERNEAGGNIEWAKIVDREAHEWMGKEEAYIKMAGLFYDEHGVELSKNIEIFEKEYIKEN